MQEREHFLVFLASQVLPWLACCCVKRKISLIWLKNCLSLPSAFEASKTYAREEHYRELQRDKIERQSNRSKDGMDEWEKAGPFKLLVIPSSLSLSLELELFSWVFQVENTTLRSKLFCVGHWMIISPLRWIADRQRACKLLVQNGNAEVVFVLRVQTGKLQWTELEFSRSLRKTACQGRQTEWLQVGSAPYCQACIQIQPQTQPLAAKGRISPLPPGAYRLKWLKVPSLPLTAQLWL